MKLGYLLPTVVSKKKEEVPEVHLSLEELEVADDISPNELSQLWVVGEAECTPVKWLPSLEIQLVATGKPAGAARLFVEALVQIRIMQHHHDAEYLATKIMGEISSLYASHEEWCRL